MSTKPKNQDRPLHVAVSDGVLTIEIGVDLLASAIARSDKSHRFDEAKDEYVRDFAIIDTEQFARDVAHAMTAEEEDGSTPLTRLLDEMGRDAIDDGSAGVKHDQRVAFDTKHPAEKW